MPAAFEKTYYIETFGCQMNVHDSEKIRGMLSMRGYQQTASLDEASLVLYNTCSIRDKAEQKVFHRLDTLKRRSKGKKIGVLGCVAQHNGEDIFEAAPHVDLVCGSASYNQLPQLLDRLDAGEKRVTGLDLDTDETYDLPAAERDNPYSAFITIIEGCNKNCSYCVVPFTRGPERSRTSTSVLEEAARIVERGTADITLLGQTVNSYRDPSEAGWSFARLLSAIGKIDGVRRVRFTTSHPQDFTPDIVEAIDSNERLCDWIHLPVQSGSTRLLSKMRRTYSRDQYLKVIEMIKAAPRPIALSTDIIVGFPGETQQDFEDTLSLLQEVEFDSLFAFKYSARRGTDSMDYDDHVPDLVQKERLVILQELQRRIQRKHNEARLGIHENALVERFRDKFQQWVGRTTQNRVLNFDDPNGIALDENLLGAYCTVHVTKAGPNALIGELVSVDQRPAGRRPKPTLRVLQ
jgi:tRNA-2-methylthio-N6-dimethylallyladenosine synthase